MVLERQFFVHKGLNSHKAGGLLMHAKVVLLYSDNEVVNRVAASAIIPIKIIK